MRPLVGIESRHNANRRRVFWTSLALVILSVAVLFWPSGSDASSPSRRGWFCKGSVVGWTNDDGEVTAIFPVGSKGCEEVLRAAVTR